MLVPCTGGEEGEDCSDMCHVLISTGTFIHFLAMWTSSGASKLTYCAFYDKSMTFGRLFVGPYQSVFWLLWQLIPAIIATV